MRNLILGATLLTFAAGAVGCEQDKDEQARNAMSTATPDKVLVFAPDPLGAANIDDFKKAVCNSDLQLYSRLMSASESQTGFWTRSLTSYETTPTTQEDRWLGLRDYYMIAYGRADARFSMEEIDQVAAQIAKAYEGTAAGESLAAWAEDTQDIIQSGGQHSDGRFYTMRDTVLGCEEQ